MGISHFFIRRPIFAAVIAIIITIVGSAAYFGLSVSQFPDVVPLRESRTAFKVLILHRIFSKTL